MTTSTLTALSMKSRDSRWLEQILTRLQELGYSSERLKFGLKVWTSERTQPVPGGGSFTDGWNLRSLWLGRGRDALAILPQRIYLQADGAIDRRPEREIVNLDKKPITPIADRIESIKQLMHRLKSACDSDLGDPVALALDDTNLTDGVMLSGVSRSFSAATKLRQVHEHGSFHTVPDDIQVLMCCDDCVSPSVLDSYAAHARAELEKRNTTFTFKSTSMRKLETKLDTLDQGATPKRRDVPTLFILARRSTPPSTGLFHLMKRLDRHRLPWRRAYADDNQKWSVPDQLCSLLQAAGGHSHAVALKGGECLPWSIGIDLSHRKNFSRAAAALINPDGQLSGAWTLDHARRREDINPAVLRRLLLAAAKEIPSSQRTDGILVVRDGRLFERENSDFYRRDLGGPVTLVELRKSGNPPLLIGSDSLPPCKATVAWLSDVPGESIGFLVTLPRLDQGDFDSVIKIRLPEAWDGMRLGRDRLARILVAQTLSPGLGLHPRYLPAPIYWADGIAGASDSDLRFRGQAVIALD